MQLKKVSTPGRRRRSRMAVVPAVLLAVALTPFTPFPAVASAAGAQVSVSPGTADPEYATVLQLRGNGFQSVQGGHGGVYVLFGWVSNPAGGWQPSSGGAAGATYRYVQDSEARDNSGFQRYVAYDGSDTASSANGGTIGADGSWSTELIVPGARFAALDRAGQATQVDCATVQCGIITVGAHGVVNPANETFTPISFAVPQQEAVPPAAPPAPAEPEAEAPPAPAPSVTTDLAEARVGEQVAVAGTGFTPGEEVAVVLHSDPVPLPAVRADESGAFQYSAAIPEDVPEGAHRIVFTGSQSTVETAVEIAVRPAAQAAAESAPAPAPLAQTSEPAENGANMLVAVIAGAAVLLIVVAVAVFLRVRRRNRTIEGN